MLKYPCLVLDHDDTVVQSEATVNHPFFVEFLKEYRPGMTITVHEYISECYAPGYIPMCRQRFHFTDEELEIEYKAWKEHIKHHAPEAYPGIADVLRRYKEAGGIIIVASPQELVSMVVEKAVKMAEMMNIPVIGLVENMSYIECPDCGKKIYPFGEGAAERVAKEQGIPLLARLPIDPALAKACDAGMIELFNENWLDPVLAAVEKEG